MACPYPAAVVPRWAWAVGLPALLLAGCGPDDWSVSADPADLDLEPWNPAVVTGPGFSVRPDVRVFAVQAFLNTIGGYDTEWGDSLSSSRQALRADVAARLRPVEPNTVHAWQRYYQSHPSHPWAYHCYSLSLGAPPDFPHVIAAEETTYPDAVRHLVGFNEVLAEFWRDAGLQELYETRYRDIMSDEANRYDPQRIAAQMAYVHEYTRVPPSQVGQFDVVILPVPFESHHTAYAAPYRAWLYLIDGPGTTEHGLNLHEYLHPLVEVVLPADLGGQRRLFSQVLKRNSTKRLVQGNYEDTRVFVVECLVRALYYRIRVAMAPTDQDLRRRVPAHMRSDVAGGLVLVDGFHAALGVFEAEPDLTLSAFLGRTLARYQGE